MIKYFDGQTVCLGDQVDFDGEPATVTTIFETPEQFTETGFEEPVVGFMTGTLGEVFQAPSDLGWDGVKLLSRAQP